MFNRSLKYRPKIYGMGASELWIVNSQYLKTSSEIPEKESSNTKTADIFDESIANWVVSIDIDHSERVFQGIMDFCIGNESYYDKVGNIPLKLDHKRLIVGFRLTVPYHLNDGFKISVRVGRPRSRTRGDYL